MRLGSGSGESVRYDRQVLGYHGCTEVAAQQIHEGGRFKPSANDFDWLGKGTYFWEFGPDRALRFIEEKLARQGSAERPAVVGAIIQLGTCFDLLDTENTSSLSDVFPLFEKAMAEAGQPLPVNAGASTERKLRRLDCAVLNWYLDLAGGYQTVRGCFLEGPPVFPGAALLAEAHIQLAVRDLACIIGTFRPTLRS